MIGDVGMSETISTLHIKGDSTITSNVSGIVTDHVGRGLSLISSNEETPLP